MGTKKYPSEIRAQAVALFQSGMPTAEIGRATGVPKSSLLAWAKAAGIQLKANTPLPSEVRFQAIALYRSGMQGKQIAANLGIAATSLWNWVRAAGVPLQREVLHPTTLRLNCQRDYEQGLGAALISERSGIPVSTCKRWIYEWRKLSQQAAQLSQEQSHAAERPFQRVRGQSGIDRAIWR